MLLSEFMNSQTRYLNTVFANVSTTNDVTFSTNIPTIKTTNLFGNKIANENSFGQVTTNLKMDIYQPSGDTNQNRPVIIFAFGGGFVNGSKREDSMIKLCQEFAKRGFVTASIDYRVGMNISDKELSKRAVYRGIQDGRSAVRFFRRNASTYKIDPNKIFMGGHSAGAFIALHNIYLDKDNERPASTRLYQSRPDLGELDAIGDNKTFANGNKVSGKANGAISLAGALGELSYIESSNDIPCALFHSSNDPVIPFNSGEPFSFLSFLPGFNLPTTFGGNEINNRANQVGLTREFFSYPFRGHSVHFTRGNLYSDIGPKAANFLYNKFLLSNNLKIQGETSICNANLKQNYNIVSDGAYFDWKIKGGKILNTNGKNVEVIWDETGDRSLSVTPYSLQLAKSEDLSLEITENLPPIALKELENEVSDNELSNYFSDPEGKSLSYKTTKTEKFIIIEAIDENNCSTTKVIDINNNLKINISPNPFVDVFQIDLSSIKNDGDITIYDIDGKEVYKNHLETKEMKSKNIEIGSSIKKPGIYFVKFNSEDGSSYQKIIKN